MKELSFRFLEENFLNKEITIYIEDPEKGVVGRLVSLIGFDEKFLFIKNEKGLAEALDKSRIIRMVNKNEEMI